jgi:hypothetical protein
MGARSSTHRGSRHNGDPGEVLNAGTLRFSIAAQDYEGRSHEVVGGLICDLRVRKYRRPRKSPQQSGSDA